MKKLLLPNLFMAVLLIRGSAFGAQPSAQDLLRKAFAAETTARYEATAVTSIRVNGTGATARLRIYRSGQRSRMEYLTGPSAGTVIVENGDTVTTLPPRGRCMGARVAPRSSESLDNLLANYVPKVSGSGKVAGRDAYVIQLVPRLRGNPSGKMWVDTFSFVILRNERYASNGEMIRSTRFEKVDYSARPADSLFLVPGGSAAAGQPYESADAVRRAVGFAPLKPGYVPKGYAFAGYYVNRAPCGVSFAGLKYANGLSAISVLERKCPCAGPGCPGRGRGRRMGRGMGACMLARNPQAKVFQTAVGDINVVVVGDAPDAELRRMADSFK